MHEYIANLHVHSTYSDGTGTIEEIAKAAGRAGVDIVGITDHHGLKGLSEGKEGWHGKVLVLVGEEIGGEHNHYLAWRIARAVPDSPENPQAVIDWVKSQGGIGFIAHPFEKGSKYGFSGKAFTWTNWNVSGFTGIEIWNFTSQWKGPIDNPLKAVYYYLYRRGAVIAPDKETLARWDLSLSKGKVSGIGGTDAHAFRFGFGPIKPKIFPYRYLFKTINTHILLPQPLTGDVAIDRKLVYAALERGRCFASYDLIGSGRGFSFSAHTPSQGVTMGEEIFGSNAVKLEIRLPKRTYIRVIKDGVVWREGYGKYHMYTAKKPGAYRVEAYRKGITGKLRAWIFSNPIYVRP